MADHPLFIAFVILIHILGLICAGSAVLHSRTPQGTAAWVIALLFIPFLSVPFFFLMGRTKFEGYSNKRRGQDAKINSFFRDLSLVTLDPSTMPESMRLIASTIPLDTQPGFTGGNKIEVLINGDETYSSMLEELEKAQNYIIIQFYIFRGDEIGNRFAEVLKRKARQGVRVSFLHDEVGARTPKTLINELKEAGVKFAAFNDQSWRLRLQVNFRNHRKILIVDGKVGYLGGLNIGDDYLGKWKKWGFWRDTHVKLQGPSVIAAQLASAKDWFFVHETPLEADWDIHPVNSQSQVLVLHSGPADEKHSGLLLHLSLINSAKKRLWIVTPYFVPPESLLDAMLLADLRGVDVRILVPERSDSRWIDHASKVYQERGIDHGIRVYRYTKGFLHQKVILVDEEFATVGSPNMDCRSMFINFEILALSTDKEFIAKIESMLLNDFNDSEIVEIQEFKGASLLEKIQVRGANIVAPIL